MRTERSSESRTWVDENMPESFSVQDNRASRPVKLKYFPWIPVPPEAYVMSAGILVEKSIELTDAIWLVSASFA